MTAEFLTKAGLVYPGDGSPRKDRRFVSGLNFLVDAVQADIWTTDTVKAYPTVAATASIVSTSGVDTLAGTGAQRVFVEGLDANWNLVSETVDLNGTTPVVTTNSYIRLLQFRTVQAGSGGQNAGVLNATIGGALQAQLTNLGGYLYNQNLGAHFSVPAGMIGHLLKVGISVSSLDANIPNAFFTVLARKFGEPFYAYKILASQLDDYVYNFEMPEPFPEMSDIVIRGVNISAANFAIVAASMEFLLTDKPIELPAI